MTEEVIRAIVRDEIKKASPKTEEMKESCVDIRGFDPTGEGSAYQPEPAPGSDAEHPPVGYRLVEMRGKVDKASVCWKHGVGPWVPNTGWMLDDVVGPINTPIANPIPANDGDSRVTESVEIEDSRITHARALADDRERALARVAELEAENAELRNRNNGLQGALDERKMRVRELIEQESRLREKIARIREVAG